MKKENEREIFKSVIHGFVGLFAGSICLAWQYGFLTGLGIGLLSYGVVFLLTSTLTVAIEKVIQDAKQEE